MGNNELSGSEIRALVKEYWDRDNLTVARKEDIENDLYYAVKKLIGKAECVGWNYFKRKYHISFSEYSHDRIYNVDIGEKSFEVFYWCYLDQSCQDGFTVSLDDVVRWADGDFTEEKVEGRKVNIASLKSKIAECERIIKTNQDNLEGFKKELAKYEAQEGVADGR